MPQANVWQRCSCPAGERHPEKACPTLAGFEGPQHFVCMDCLTQCGLYIIPTSPYTYSDYFGAQRTGMRPATITSTRSQGRAGDEDREEAFARLEEAFVKGKLTQQEYQQRLDRVGSATWKAEIRAYLADLPPWHEKRNVP